MKSRDEIQEMLVAELCINATTVSSNHPLDYYNDKFGDSSFLLAALLQQLLAEKFDDWDVHKWIDDSLLTKVNFADGKMSIWGVVIWGIEDVTEQWTDPFYFEIQLTQDFSDYEQYTFLFADLNNPEITYEYFKENRDYWDRGYNLNDKWNLANREWRYIIHIKNKDE